MGYLDHALSSPSLTEYVSVGMHINADEPRVFDYNVEYKLKTSFLVTTALMRIARQSRPSSGSA